MTNFEIRCLVYPRLITCPHPVRPSVHIPVRMNPKQVYINSISSQKDTRLFQKGVAQKTLNPLKIPKKNFKFYFIFINMLVKVYDWIKGFEFQCYGLG